MAEYSDMNDHTRQFMIDIYVIGECFSSSREIVLHI